LGSAGIAIEGTTEASQASAAVLLFEGQMATVTLQTVVSELLLGLQNYTEQAADDEDDSLLGLSPMESAPSTDGMSSPVIAMVDTMKISDGEIVVNAESLLSEYQPTLATKPPDLRACAQLRSEMKTVIETLTPALSAMPPLAHLVPQLKRFVDRLPGLKRAELLQEEAALLIAIKDAMGTAEVTS